MLYGCLYSAAFIVGEMREIFKVLIGINNSLVCKRSVCRVKVYSTPACFQILQVLYREGYILNYTYNKIDKYVYITHNYYKNRPTINVLKVFNKASFPVYIKYTDLLAMHKFGIDVLILSTTKGLMPHYKAIKEKLGGRLICYLR